MAIRPIYISTKDISNPVLQKDINFNWISGLSYEQKCKRRDSLANSISNLYDLNEWLEVSTKSDKDIGIKLSALNLKLHTLYEDVSVEQIYQNSKVYCNKKIVGFKYGNIEFSNKPYGMFYDYIYMRALLQNPQFYTEIKNYNIFTDVEFNPYRQLNTQARAIAIFKTLYDTNNLDILNDLDKFKKFYADSVKLTGLYKKDEKSKSL